MLNWCFIYKITTFDRQWHMYLKKMTTAKAAAASAESAMFAVSSIVADDVGIVAAVIVLGHTWNPHTHIFGKNHTFLGHYLQHLGG